MQLRFTYLCIVLLCLQVSVTIADTHIAIEPEASEQSSFLRYDGRWEFGLGLELTEMGDFEGGDIGWAIIIGKDFYHNDDISLGAQVHFSRSFIDVDDISDRDEASRDSTNLFATAHFKGFSAVKFKLGASYTKLDTFAGVESDTGMIYGVDLVLGNNSRIYLTVLSFEDSISGADYRALFLNLFIFLAR